ncbi:MAG: alpha/beta hydrolase [Chitinophagales bacterium]|nr:alpha/beta hydrolase [Chitinophagales bacterium]
MIKNKLYIPLLVAVSIATSSCDALLQTLQKSNQDKVQANKDAGNAPKRAYTLKLPPNPDRILPDGYAPGDILNTQPSPWGVRYKDFVFSDYNVTTEYYKRQAPMWDGSRKNLIMDIVSPVNDGERKRPCLVFLFGGGFAGKFDDCTQEIAKGFAQKGYVVALPDYRVGFKNDLLAGQCIGDFNTGMYPAFARAVQDARSAIRYLKANATRLGIDPNLIFLSGHSAGALVTIAVPITNDTNLPKEILAQVGGTLDPMNDNMQYDTKIAGGIALAGAVVDPYLIVGKKIDTPMDFFAGTCDELIDMYSGNPFRCQDRKTFPIAYGGAAIYEASRQSGNPVHLNMICNGSHSMSSIGYSKLIELMDNFTYSVLKGNPIIGKSIIPAEKGVCNKPELCK